MRKRPIHVGEGRYLAGDDGKIYGPSGKAMRGWKCKDGYVHVSLSLERRVRKVPHRFPVHRLVCIAFHGQPLASGLQVRHLDGVRTNNVPSNLAWGTISENSQDRIAHGRTFVGLNNPNALLTKREIAAIRNLYAAGLAQDFISEALNISQSHVSRIVRGQVHMEAA